MREITVDNFAGGGGAPMGIGLAVGHSVDIAINHNENAIAVHKTNHSDALHYCESVFDVDLITVTSDNSVGPAWFSPDCRHLSGAKGAEPVKKKIRGLAWTVLRWTLARGPHVMILESVEEFKTWGPLLADEMRPDPVRTGEAFNVLVGMLSTDVPADHSALSEVCEFLPIERDSEQARQLVDGSGYDVDYRGLRACDYGAPTIRKRFFTVIRCDGCPTQRSAIAHGDPRFLEVQSDRLMPWRTAVKCIDWNVPASSTFDHKKPSKENILKRVARDIRCFIIGSSPPFIAKCNHTSTKTSYDCFRGQVLGEPLRTITKAHGYTLAALHLIELRTGATGQPATEPAPTATADMSERPDGNRHALGIVGAALTSFPTSNGSSEYQAKPRPPDKPAHIILEQSRACLVVPVIARQFGASAGHRVDEPSATITANGDGKSQLVTPTLIQVGYSGRPGQEPRVLRLDNPLGAATTGGSKSATMGAFLAKHYGGNYTGSGVSMDEPTYSVATVDHRVVVASYLVRLCGTCRDGQHLDVPMPTITAGGQHAGGIRTFFETYCGESDDEWLVTIDGVKYQIVGIEVRMLQLHELYKTQGPPDGRVTGQDYRGDRYAKDKQVARCGNTVPPPFARVPAEVNLPELCAVQQQEVA